MKKFLIILMSLLLAGCGSAKTSNIDKTDVSEDFNIYYNPDNRCVDTRIIEKEYKDTDPQQMLEQVDYVFIGTINESKSEIYDNGKIKENLKVTVKKMIKGKLDNEVTISRDGGRVSVPAYIQYPGETILNKDSLAGLSGLNLSNQLNGQIYVEVVPKAYFMADNTKEYVFFVRDNNGLEIYNDAYGMLEVIDQDKAKNVYSNEECTISELSK